MILKMKGLGWYKDVEMWLHNSKYIDGTDYIAKWGGTMENYWNITCRNTEVATILQLKFAEYML